MKNILIIIIVVVVALVATHYIFSTSNERVVQENLGEQVKEEDTAEQALPSLNEGSNDPATSEVTNEGSDAAVSNTIVTYTAVGFSPSPLTIKKGDTVTFENESGPLMWVASAQHPTHTVYPEKTSSDCLGSSFDQCEGVGAGRGWSFTFNEVGEWGYHNHLRASHWGRIVVEE
ncbi:MAG: hypothetical protein WD003_01350 [Candidatus Paceibacterota bacterium]